MLLFASAACQTPDPVPPPAVQDPSSFLGLATAVVFDLPDVLDQAELFAEVAAAYLEVGDESSARAVAERARQRAVSAGDGEESLRVRLSLVPTFSVLDSGTTVSLLETVLSTLDRRADDVLRATLIPPLIESALAAGEPARFALREGVDLSYIILDPGRRARTLIEVASLYQRSGIGLSVTALIQQAIPAVRSVASPYQQAELLASLAVLADTAGERGLADRLVDIAERVLADGQTPSDPVGRAALLAAGWTFGALGDRAAVQLIADLLPAGYERVVLELELALLVPLQSTRRARLAESFEQMQNLDDPFERAAALIALAEAAWEEGAAELSLQATGRVQQLVAASGNLQADEALVQRLIRLRVLQDEIEAITGVMNAAESPYIRGLMAVDAADGLIAAERLTLAEDFLVVGLLASDETTFLSDSLRVLLAERFARARSVRLAIRTIERMDDPLFRARAVVAVAAVAQPAGLTTPLLQADLASVLR